MPDVESEQIYRQPTGVDLISPLTPKDYEPFEAKRDRQTALARAIGRAYGYDIDTKQTVDLPFFLKDPKPKPDAPKPAVSQTKEPPTWMQTVKAEALKRLDPMQDPAQRILLGGIKDALVNGVRTFEDASNWIHDHLATLLAPHGDAVPPPDHPSDIANWLDSVLTPYIASAQNPGERFARSLVGIFAPVLGAEKLVEPTTRLGKAVTGLAGGAVADVTFIDPDDPLVLQTFHLLPSDIQDAFESYLGGSSDDEGFKSTLRTRMHHRFGNVVEGGIFGLGIEGLFLLGRAWKAARLAKHAADALEPPAGATTQFAQPNFTFRKQGGPVGPADIIHEGEVIPPAPPAPRVGHVIEGEVVTPQLGRESTNVPALVSGQGPKQIVESGASSKASGALAVGDETFQLAEAAQNPIPLLEAAQKADPTIGGVPVSSIPRLKQLAENENFPDVARYIDSLATTENPKYLKSGIERSVFDLGNGRVAKVGVVDTGKVVEGKVVRPPMHVERTPDLPEFNPPLARQRFGNLEVEVSRFVPEPLKRIDDEIGRAHV